MTGSTETAPQEDTAPPAETAEVWPVEWDRPWTETDREFVESAYDTAPVEAFEDAVDHLAPGERPVHLINNIYGEDDLTPVMDAAGRIQEAYGEDAVDAFGDWVMYGDAPFNPQQRRQIKSAVERGSGHDWVRLKTALDFDGFPTFPTTEVEEHGPGRYRIDTGADGALRGVENAMDASEVYSEAVALCDVYAGTPPSDDDTVYRGESSQVRVDRGSGTVEITVTGPITDAELYDVTRGISGTGIGKDEYTELVRSLREPPVTMDPGRTALTAHSTEQT